MKHDFTNVQNISSIICGETDMRKGIDGLATLIQEIRIAMLFFYFQDGVRTAITVCIFITI